jgi:hypothetical protein
VPSSPRVCYCVPPIAGSALFFLFLAGPGRTVDIEIRELVRIEHRSDNACLQLIAEVVEQSFGDREQHYQREQIDDREDTHHRVGEEEHRRRTGCDRAEEDDGGDSDTKYMDSRWAFGHYRHCVLTQIVVVDDGTERKEKDGGCQEVLYPFAKMRHQRLLGEGNTVDPLCACNVDITEKDDEGGAAADDDGVDKDREGLGDALAYRMTDI